MFEQSETKEYFVGAARFNMSGPKRNHVLVNDPVSPWNILGKNIRTFPLKLEKLPILTEYYCTHFHKYNHENSIVDLVVKYII